MSGETGIGGHLRGLWAEIKSQLKKLLAAKIIALGLLVIAGASAVAASVLRGASELQRGMLFGGACALLAVATSLAVAGLWSYLRRKPQPPPAVELAPPASVYRLSEAHLPCNRAFVYAHEYLWTDLCSAAVEKGGDKAMIGAFLQDHLVRPFSEEASLLAVRVHSFANKPPSPEDFHAALAQFVQLLSAGYPRILGWILRAGESVYGREKLLASEGYAGLYLRHSDVVQEIQRVRAWPDISGLASWHQSLTQALPPPKPSADPERSTASEQSPPPLPGSSEFPGAST